jgi:hypothetical protein
MTGDGDGGQAGGGGDASRTRSGRTSSSKRSSGSQRPVRLPFLSDEWIAEARRIRAEYRGRTSPIPVAMRMNQIIEEVPFGTGRVDAHLDTSDGEMDFDVGHLDQPDLTVVVDYETARKILVDGDAQAALQALVGGRIRVDGDITKLLGLPGTPALGGGDPLAAEMARRVQEITA